MSTDQFLHNLQLFHYPRTNDKKLPPLAIAVIPNMGLRYEIRDTTWDIAQADKWMAHVVEVAHGSQIVVISGFGKYLAFSFSTFAGRMMYVGTYKLADVSEPGFHNCAVMVGERAWAYDMLPYSDLRRNIIQRQANWAVKGRGITELIYCHDSDGTESRVVVAPAESQMVVAQVSSLINRVVRRDEDVTIQLDADDLPVVTSYSSTVNRSEIVIDTDEKELLSPEALKSFKGILLASV